MKSVLIAAGFVLTASGFWASPADAAGCLKGALVGGVAGHYMHRQGVLGAGVGCLIGRHEANKRAREQAAPDQNYYTSYQSR